MTKTKWNPKVRVRTGVNAGGPELSCKTRGFMLMASIALGSLGCPMPVEEVDPWVTSGAGDEETGDEETGEVDDGELVPIPDMAWVDAGELGETGDTGETGELGETCGDFAVQAGEECDGWNTNFESCLAFGFSGGQLACNDDCTFDVSDCIEMGCGNGIIETMEKCDGSPYPCWLLGFAGSTDSNGMTPCEADCTPGVNACVAACEWGQPGCFCSATTPCPEGYLCSPHPQGWAGAPGTCELAECANVGSACVPTKTSWSPCCPGLQCVDSVCM